MQVRLVAVASVLSLIPLSACDPCDDCQAALDHMASKIEGQACNPNFMQKALSRIEDDCKKKHPDWEEFVSHLVDECQSPTATIDVDCSSGKGFDHAFPLALLPSTAVGSVSAEAVLLNGAGVEIFVGPWEGEGYTITASSVTSDETYTFGLRNVGDTELTREISFQAPQRQRWSWSPYSPRAIRISDMNLTLENFEVEDPAEN